MSDNFSRRDFIKGITTGAVLTAGGVNLSCQPAQRGMKKAAARNSAMKTFTKALWIHIGRSFPNGEKDVPKVLDKWADAGFNLLIPAVRGSTGETLYQRTKYPVSEQAKEWDPVAVINAEAKKRGMRVHPWCSVFRGAKSKFAHEHPEFIGLDKNGKNTGAFLCAAQDTVQDWAYSFFEELMDNYDVAGVHHDYIRYNDYLCWCDYCKKVFKREAGTEMKEMETGSGEWARWITQRVHNINKFVKKVQDEATKRDKETSAAVFASYPYCVVSVAQDWLTWAHEKWVDYILPMNYWGDEKRFFRYADIHIKGVNGSVPVFEGIANKLPNEVFKIDLTPEELLERSQSVKSMGFQGICYFASGYLSDEDLKMIKKL